MLISLIRTLLIYIIIITAVRLMGKRQISQLQTTELVVTLLISDLAVIPMQDSGQPLASGLIPIFFLIGFEIILTIFMLKSSKFRRLLCGRPIVVISDGVILQKEMKELRMSTEDLFEELRQKDVFSINEVKFAIVETNGILSVIKKDQYSEVVKGDLEIKSNSSNLEVVVISDGEICKSSLAVCKTNLSKLISILNTEKRNIEDIYIMTLDTIGNYNIIVKEGVS